MKTSKQNLILHNIQKLRFHLVSDKKHLCFRLLLRKYSLQSGSRRIGNITSMKLSSIQQKVRTSKPIIEKLNLQNTKGNQSIIYFQRQMSISQLSLVIFQNNFYSDNTIANSDVIISMNKIYIILYRRDGISNKWAYKTLTP